MEGIERIIRLNKYIAKSGLYSRRQADSLVFNGAVSLNGVTVFDPSIKVKENIDKVFVNDQALNCDKEIFIKFYKPINVLSSYVSQGDKKNLGFYKPFDKMRLAYAGRLDYKSEGLMLFCNCGDIINRLLLPINNIEREYIVYVDRALNNNEINKLREGIIFKDITYRGALVYKIGNLKYRVIIKEGKKREVRNMFKYFNVNVKKLIRIRFGEIKLGSLLPGKFKFLDNKEVNFLKNV
ncbi:MAG: pseudouridine synthase [Deferribacterota bacterium]|nr:pseudouridine synthase [Deferribacterota bacterium]